MANYFYVKAGLGTRTTDTVKTSAETGAFGATGLLAADVYDNFGVLDGLTTVPTDGDFIMASSAHTKTYDAGANITFNNTGASDGVGLQIISVDDSNANQYLPGANEELNDGADDYVSKFNVFVAGVTLKTGDNVFIISQRYSNLFLLDATVNIDNDFADLAFSAVTDKVSITCTNVDIAASGTTSSIIELYEGRFTWNGGALSGTVPTQFCRNLAINGTAIVEIKGVDLSGFTGQLMMSLTTTSGQCLFRLINCELNSSVTLHGTLVRPDHRLEMFNCDNGTDDKFYRFYIADSTGSAKNNDSVYVTAGESWYGGTDHSSIQVDTEALCSHAIPFVFELPAQYIDLAGVATDTLTIDMATAETLVKHDLAAFLVYPDGTTAVTPVWVSSGPSVTGFYGIDPLDTSTVMPPSALGSGDWTGSPGANRYELVLDTSGTPGQAAAVSVRIEVYKASIGPIYIHPLITVSAT